MATFTWTGSGSLTGNWSSGTNWNGTPNNTTPAGTNEALINQAGTGAYTVAYDTTSTLAGLAISNANASLRWDTVTARAMTVSGATTLSAGTIDLATTTKSGSSLSTASLAVSGGTFKSGNTVAVSGLANFTGGTEAISGGTFNAGTLTVAGGTLTQSGGTTTSAGPTNLSSGSITINNAAGTLTTGTFAESGTGSFSESAGKLSVTGAGAAALSVAAGSFSLSGTGAVAVTNGASFTGGTEAISGGTFNAGSLTVGGGALTQSGGTTTTAGATNLSSGSITINNAAGTLTTGTFAESGTGSFSESAGKLSVTGAGATALSVAAGSFSLSGTGAIAVTNGASFTGGTAAIQGGAFNTATLAVGGAGALTQSGGTITSTGATNLTSGSITIDNAAGTLTTGTFAASGTGSFSESAGKLSVTGAGAAALSVAAAASFTLSGGTVVVTNGASFTGGIENLNGNFEAGSLTVDGGTLSTAGTTTSDGATILSSGSIAVTGGTLSTASLAASGGQLTQGDPATVNVTGAAAFAGGLYGLFGGTFTAGTLSIAGGSIDAGAGTLTSKGATVLASGLVTVRNLATLDTASLTVSGGQLNQGDTTSKVNVAGAATFTGGNAGLSGGAFNAGALTVAGGSIGASGGTLTSGSATDLSSGSITITGPATFNTDSLAISSTGVLGASAGGKVNVTGPSGLLVAGELLPDSESGPFNVFAGGDVEVTTGASFTGGIAQVAGSLATFNTDSLAISDTGVFRVSTGGKVNVTGPGGLSVAGQLLPPDTAGTKQTRESFNVFAGGDVRVTNGISVTGGVAQVSGNDATSLFQGNFEAGSLTVAGGEFRTGGTTKLDGATILSSGTIELFQQGTAPNTLSTEALAISGTGVFTQSVVSAVNVTGLASLTGGSATISGGTFNAGTLSVAGGTFTESGGVVTALGAAAFTGGTEALSGDFEAGSLAVAGGALSVGGGTTKSDGATVLSSGSIVVFGGTLSTASLAVSGGALSHTAALEVAGNASFTGGTDGLFGGTFDVGSLTVAGGAISAISGTLTSKGATDLSSGSINLSGPAALNTDSLAVSGTGVFAESAGAVNVTGLANLTGTVESISGGTFNAGTLVVGDGTNAQTVALIGATTTATVGGLTTINNAGSISLSGASLAATGGIGNSGMLSGSGKVSGGAISGTGAIIAAGGTLDIANAINSGTTLAANPGANLKLGGAVTSAGTIDLFDPTQTVEIDSAGALTINQAQTIGASTVKLDGGSLIDASGITIVGGGTIIGSGTVQADLANPFDAGFVKASGGELAVNGNLASTLKTSIDNASTLSLGGTVGSGLIVDYGSNASAELELNAGALTSFETNGIISGMSVGTGITPTDVLDLTSINFGTIASAALGNGGTQIELFNSGSAVVASFNLDAPVAGAFVHWTADEGTGTNVFLSDTPVCFASGTRILAARGEVAVEHLTTHDAVVTLDDGKQVARPVKWLGRRRIDLTAHPQPETVAPIRILRGAFADNVPRRDVVVSPDHALFADGRLICARQLINGTTIRQEQDWKSIDYFHVELDAHAILLADGLPAESYLNTGNQGFFANSDQPLVLHPDLTDETDYPTREVGSCAPFVWDEDNVRPVWQRLAERAAVLGRPVAQPDTTTDAELHIVANGRTLRPLHREKGSYIFALPKGAKEVRVTSRAGAPTDVRPWLEDRRSLGVYVERIVLRGASEVHEVPLDHPSLWQGWWAVERDGGTMRRWTNGEAVLPLPASHGPTTLEISASNGAMGYVVKSDQGRYAA